VWQKTLGKISPREVADWEHRMKMSTVELEIGLTPRVNISRTLQNYVVLKLPVIGSSTVQCYVFWNFKSGVFERFRRSKGGLRVPGRLMHRIFLTLGTTRVVGRQPHAPAAFAPGEIPGTHF
jgi:hypothetical protein